MLFAVCAPKLLYGAETFELNPKQLRSALGKVAAKVLSVPRTTKFDTMFEYLGWLKPEELHAKRTLAFAIRIVRSPYPQIREVARSALCNANLRWTKLVSHSLDLLAGHLLSDVVREWGRFVDMGTIALGNTVAAAHPFLKLSSVDVRASFWFYRRKSFKPFPTCPDSPCPICLCSSDTVKHLLYDCSAPSVLAIFDRYGKDKFSTTDRQVIARMLESDDFLNFPDPCETFGDLAATDLASMHTELWLLRYKCSTGRRV